MAATSRARRRWTMLSGLGAGLLLALICSLVLAPATPPSGGLHAQSPPQAPPSSKDIDVPKASPRGPTTATPGQPPAPLVTIEPVEPFVRNTVIASEALAKLTISRRFTFNIKPDTPLDELLPRAPQMGKVPPLVNDLAQVPELIFEAPTALKPDKAQEHIAHQIAKINHLNQKKMDAFMHVLLERRPDLKGLPFVMGDACRTRADRSRQFARAVEGVRTALRGPIKAGSVEIKLLEKGNIKPERIAAIVDGTSSTLMLDERAFFAAAGPPVSPEVFWETFRNQCAAEDKANRAANCDEALVTSTRIAALMQMLAPESAALRAGLAKYLAGVSHVEATRALANLALFSDEADVRQAAIDGLKVRRERDYTDLLMAGFRYPLPAVGQRAAEALIRLERQDLIPRLVDILDEADPRAPATHDVDNKKTSIVRELVRVNHHKNCLMCHAPSNPASPSADALTAEVPTPGQPLPTPSEGYHNSSPDLLVRIDVTYLRQDFSRFLAVSEAQPWPQMQRFDFLVRTRELSADEAKALAEAFANKAPGVLPPNHRAALAALRELTGRDTAPTADAWRRLLAVAAPARPVNLE